MRISRLAAFVGAVVTLASLTACGSDGGSSAPDPSASSATPSAASSSTDTAGAVTCSYVPGTGAARDVQAPPSAPTVAGDIAAVLNTSAGDIPMTLTADRTPCTVGSFVSLAEQGYFDDTQCHRLTTSGIYVLQCGDPTGSGRGGPGYSYRDELDGTETYPAGTVAMANAGPNTNGSQFFLVYDESPLPPSYTVLGQMDEAGLATVRAIAERGTASGAGDGAPAEAVTITGVTIG